MQHANGRNAKLIKIHNRALVLKIIQQNSGISRKEIAQTTGLTQAAITKITQQLYEQGLIVESAQESGDISVGFGRRPIGLMINQHRYRVIALHIGRHTLKGAIFDLAGNLLHKQEIYQDILTTGSDALIPDLISCIQRLIASQQLDVYDILGIGIAAPGPINAQRGIILGLWESSASQPVHHSGVPFDWREIAIKEAIQQAIGVEVFADNDANLSALAESWFGNGVGLNNFVLYSIGTGIGAGVIIDGMLYRGEDDVVAEIGHITVDVNGPPCTCGNIGCLELYAGFAQIVEEYGHIPDHPYQMLHERFIHGVEHIFQAAAQGDQTALALIHKRAKFLGVGAVALANIFSPECIIVAPNDLGDVDVSLLIKEIQDSICQRAFSVIADKVNVKLAKLGADIQLYGAMAIVLQEFFVNLSEERMTT